jgi:hypothetical protein
MQVTFTSKTVTDAVPVIQALDMFVLEEIPDKSENDDAIT